MAVKAPEAFRSISEVATALNVRQHTLRAWETRFPFVKPVKRPDGRRYYRPADVAVLAKLHQLLDRDKLSTEAVLRLYSTGGLRAHRGPLDDVDPSLPRLQRHLVVLTAARARLMALLHGSRSVAGAAD